MARFLTLIAEFLGIALVAPTLLQFLLLRLKRIGMMILYGGFFISGLVVVWLVNFGPEDVIQRVPNTRGTLEAVETQGAASAGATEVRVGVPGGGPRDGQRVIMVDRISPALNLSWYGNDLRISADQAALYWFAPHVDVDTPSGAISVNVYTHVTRWVATPGSRSAASLPSQ